MTDEIAVNRQFMTHGTADQDTVDVSYPTGPYDRERAQHNFTMLIGKILVFAAIGCVPASGGLFIKEETGAGIAVLIFGVACLVLGLGAAVPDGRSFFLKVFKEFRGAMRGSGPLGNETLRTPDGEPDEAGRTSTDNNAGTEGPGEMQATGRQPAGQGSGGASGLDSREPNEQQLTAQREVTPREGHETGQVIDDGQPPDVRLAGWGRPKVRPEERWRLANGTQVHLRNHIGPTYLLDETYHFLDWNPVFEELIARELRLHRGMHAQSFVSKLANREVVIPRSQRRFPENAPPLVDLEPLVFDSTRFGRIEFQKIASRVLNDKGDTLLWVVNLNISDVEERYARALWTAIHDELIISANWTAYASSYDKLLTNFDDYGALIDMIVSRVGDAKRCVDLGTGTGNTALKLLEQPDRLVWAVEENDGMLRCLDNKIGQIVKDGGQEVAHRIFISKANITALGEFERGYFDAATMTNVFYAVDNPIDCLKEINRVLRIGGVLAFSTSTDQTDVDKLFDAMRRNLEEKSLFDSLKSNWQDAKDVHDRMITKIHKNSAADIRSYLEKSGFRIDEDAWVESAYVGAVVVAKAVKVHEAF